MIRTLIIIWFCSAVTSAVIFFSILNEVFDIGVSEDEEENTVKKLCDFLRDIWKLRTKGM